MNPLMQISEVSVKVCFVGPPRQSIDPRRGVFLEFEKRLAKQIDADVVEERGEPLWTSSRTRPGLCRTKTGWKCPFHRMNWANVTILS